MIAIADYSPLWFDELRLREGERVVFLSAICPGWFKGRMGTKVLQKLQPVKSTVGKETIIFQVGAFPGSHVKPA